MTYTTCDVHALCDRELLELAALAVGYHVSFADNMSARFVDGTYYTPNTSVG